MSADDPDWKSIAVQLAAIDHRAASIVEAADKLAEQLERYWKACTTPSRTRHPDYNIQKVIDLLEAYKTVRQGT